MRYPASSFGSEVLFGCGYHYFDGHRMDISIDAKISWLLRHFAGSKITMEERGL